MMSKIEQLKAEMAVIRDKIHELERDGDPYGSAYWEVALNIKYRQYVAVLEAEIERLKVEVKDLKDEIKSDYWPYA
jgi:hypothetical protein